MIILGKETAPDWNSEPEFMYMKDVSRKGFLYATAFFSGMSVMAIEMGASRLLTPYFSSSQVIWTIIIGIIMIAMAIGNVWGGRMADADPSPRRLYGRLLAAAVWTALIPIAGRYLILGITFLVVMAVKGSYLVWASFASCLVLFVFPLMLLGTVTPSLIKYATGSLEDNGRTVGTIEACGTIGSILGTFLPTFITIPSFGTAVTFYIFAGILALLSAFYFFSIGEHRLRGAMFAAGIIALIVLPFDTSFAFWEKDLLYEDESIYNYLRVREDEDSVILSTNVLEGIQSIYKKGGGLTGMYYDYALAAPLMVGGKEDPLSLMVLGMGTGTYARQCLEFYPRMTAEGVEIDQKIADLSRRYFDLPEEIPVLVEDGRACLRNAGSYDVIMVDAYQDITIPFQMSSAEFFTLVKEHLKPGGVMVVNMNMKTDVEGGINDYLIDTIVSVFPEVRTVLVANNTNEVLFASENENIVENLKRRTNELEDQDPLKGQLLSVLSGLKEEEGGERILTDDRAPVELLGMKALDALIADTLEAYGGLEGLLG